MTNMNSINIGWIAGMPRSGSTWLSQIFASAPDVRLKFCPLFSYEFKNALDEKSSADEWQKLFEKVYHTQSDFLDQDYLRKMGLIPKFVHKKKEPQHLIIKSTRFHNLLPGLIEKLPNIRLLNIVRHPCASIYSWLNNPYEFPEGADATSEWRTGACRKQGVGEFWGFEDWKHVTTQALKMEKTCPEHVKVLRYEDLRADPQKHTKAIFDFFGIDYEEQTASFLITSQNTHSTNKRSVFKKPELKDNWREKLPREIIDAILSETKGNDLEQFTHIENI